ncbi:MAG: hypothetical protein RIM99_06005 [Cyclobacteriaceae bacterium]
MKLRHGFVFIFPLVILIGGCDRKNNSINDRKNEQDLALRTFLNTEFPALMKAVDSVRYEKWMHRSESNNEIIIYSGPYKLKKYIYNDGHEHPIFAIKVTTVNDSLISFFSFSDELYYSNNSVSGWIVRDSIIMQENTDRLSYYKPKLDLEENLNELIHLLGFQNSHREISNLLEVIFCNLLRMETANYFEVKQMVIELENVKNDNKHIQKCVAEFSEFFDDFKHCDYGCSCFKTLTGLWAYWKMEIIEIEGNNGYHVQVEFIGDLLHYTYYL